MIGPIECQVISDPLTDDEQKECNRLKSRCFGRVATCGKCGLTARATDKTVGRAENAAVVKLAMACPEGERKYTYIIRKLPPGLALKVIAVDGKEYEGTVYGWTVYSMAAGEISKNCPIRLVALPNCNPDVRIANEFGYQLARRGYKVHMFENQGRVIAEPIPPRKRKPKAKPPEPNADKAKKKPKGRK